MAPPFRRPVPIWIAVALAALTSSFPAHAQGGMAGMSGHEHGSMSADAMRRWVKEFYATHPQVGVRPTDAAVDTFTASGTQFDTDHKIGTQVDTAFVLTGETILWRATSGAHTVTSGTGSLDPDVGKLFDASIDLFDVPTFSYTFTRAGTYPFFCRPHETFNMRGFVKVTDPACADTFLAAQTQFDTDGNPLTQVDTAFIQVGDKILWDLQDATFHTVTDGHNSTEPGAGTLFDVSLDPTASTFVYQFNETGFYPFFCRPHEFDEMKGVVVVGTPVSVVPGPSARRIGFATEPAPNPTTGRIAFRLAMPVAGRAVAEVFDAQGKLVDVPLNQFLDAGVFDAGWNGATRSGARAGAGVYHIRLSLPGYQATRRIVMAP